MPIASVEARDNTYTNLLSLLSLCPTHKSALRERGATDEEIAWLGYRTTPTTRYNRIIAELLERGCVLEGVPGFYCERESGRWVLDIRGSGIMIPCRNRAGLIEAIQVRLDKISNRKFYTFTSVDRYYGTQAKCCPHYVGVKEGDEAVCITEGIMKADLAYCFSTKSAYSCGMVGLSGANNHGQFDRVLCELQEMGISTLRIMLDSDYRSNEAVNAARIRCIEMGAAAGFEVIPVTWDAKYKGIDDLYKALFRNN